MTLDTLRQLAAFCSRSHHERATICFTDCTCDQAAPCQAIENTGQGRSLVRKPAMEFGDVGRPGMSKKS
jgi:hypothetical protein